MKRIPSVLRKARLPEPAEARNSYASPGAWLQPQSQAGVYVSPDTALNLASVFAAVNIISTDCASLPCLTYRQLSDGGKTVNPDDPLFDLLFWEADDELDSYHFTQTVFSHALTSGNGYGEISRFRYGLRAGDPGEIHLIDHKEIQPARDRRNRLVYELANGKSLLKENTLHLRGLSRNGINGISPTTRARQTIGLGQAAEIFGANFFGNGAHASGYLKTKKKLSEEAKDSFLEQQNIRHGGPYSANKLGILVGDWEFMQTGLSPEDSQFLGTRQFTVIEIARWFNINPIKLMDFTNGNFSNVETLTLDYVSTTLLPWLINWEKELALKLLPKSERRSRLIKHDLTVRLRGDSAARVAYYQGLFNIGVLSQNDIRRAEDQNPIQGGDTYFIPGNNMVPSGRAEDVASKKDSNPPSTAVAIEDAGSNDEPGTESRSLPTHEDLVDAILFETGGILAST